MLFYYEDLFYGVEPLGVFDYDVFGRDVYVYWC